MNRSKVAIISPLIIIGLGFIAAFLFSKLINEWAFIPLALLYWGGSFAVSYRFLGRELFLQLFARPQGKAVWPVICIIAGFIPLPILLMNLDLLNSFTLIILWLIFSAVNPFFEEIYWRGFLLTALPFSKSLAVVYSTLLFILSHPLMWGVFSVANRSWMTWVSLLIMGIVWSLTFIKTKSLRWCIASHILVDIFNLSVFVFLNIYVPPM